MRLLTIVIVLAQLYCLWGRTLNWFQLKSVLASKRYTLLTRSPEKEQIYSTFRNNLREKKMTMPQHIKINILGFSGHPQYPIHLIKIVFIDDKKLSVYVTGPESIWRKLIKKSTYCSRVTGIRQGSEFALLAINNFPYDLQKINHWVVWTSYPFSYKTQVAVMRQIISENIESLMYQNLVSQKSVPEINHFQLFWKKKGDIKNEL